MVSLESLLNTSPLVEQLLIRSMEGQYLVEVEYNGERHLVTDAKWQTLRFQSVQQVREHLKQLSVKTAKLVHRSPYNEMIGLPVDDVAPLEHRISWQTLAA